MRHHIAVVTLIFSSGFVLADTSPSFDCSKASNTVERLICSDNSLAELDVKLSQKYKAALSEASDKTILKQRQIEWIKGVRSKCTDTVCIADEYKKRLTEISGSSPYETKAVVVVGSSIGTQALPDTEKQGGQVPIDQMSQPKGIQANSQVSANGGVNQDIDSAFRTKVFDELNYYGIKDNCSASILTKIPSIHALISFAKNSALEDLIKQGCLCEANSRPSADVQRYRNCFNSAGNVEISLIDYSRKAIAAERKAERTKEMKEEKRVAEEKQAEKVREIEAEKIAKQELKTRQEQEKVAMESRQKQSRQNLIDTALRQSKVDSTKAGIWVSGDDDSDEKRSDLNANRCFGSVNYFVREHASYLNKFFPPEKGEFEKTDVYNSRVKIAQNEFATKQLQRNKELQDFFNLQFNDKFGRPIITNLVYDSDAELFKLSVTSSVCHFSLPISVKTTAKDAPLLKEKLLRLRPVVVLERSGESITARSVTFFDQQVVALNATPNILIEYKFNEENAKQYGIALEKSYAETQAAAAESAKRTEAQLQSKMWYRALQSINVKGYVCDGLRNQINGARNNGLDDASLNKIALSVFNDAKRSGCVQ